jgi:hypothetical protein
MARKKVSTPMLEAFLREAPAKDFGVWPQWLEWVAGAGTAFLLMSVQIDFFEKSKLWAFGIGAAVWYGFHFCREQQITRLDRHQKVHFERWSHVQRLRAIMVSGAKLSSYLPVPVAEQLEACARARLQTLEEVRLAGPTDPELVSRVTQEVDDELSLAIGSAALVTRRDEQSLKDVKMWESDESLLAPILRRISTRRERLESLAESLVSSAPESESLRDLLARVKVEREEAERELNDSLRQM